jgi:N-acetyl-gamma-glutamyl-phosphate reductase
MIKVGIIGGAGYTAGELIRILIHHPKVEIAFVHSQSNAHKPITEVHGGLLGETSLIFTDLLDQINEVNLLFFCTAHGDTKTFLQKHSLSPSVKIIDLSTDYRMKSQDHSFVYGLPELNLEQIKKAHYIANPGCFATSIQLAVLPLAQKQMANELHVHAITGSTGAGVKPSSTTHFSWRNDNISAYKIFSHQHLSEIKQSILQLQPTFNAPINFVPLRGDFARGIFTTLYTKNTLTIDAAYALYREFYESSPFTVVTDQNPDMKQVINTNKCILYLEKHDDTLVVISMIDNLLKGASGQAVENMNLMFGFDQKEGLQLKAIGF